MQCCVCLITASVQSFTHTCYFVQKVPGELDLREREENEEMRLGEGKWQHQFQFPFSSGRSEELGTDPTPIKANDKMSIDFNENMFDLLWLYCFLFSNFILWLARKFGFSFKF